MRTGASIIHAILAYVAILPIGATAQPKTTCSYDDACLRRLMAHPPLLTRARLPVGYKIGRCLLQIDGRRLIDGKCAYSIGKGGDFHIDGPHQVFDGIDYPKADIMADMISTDWWVDVFRDSAEWAGYSNGDEEMGSVHGQSSRWGKLTKSGACYISHKGGEVMQQVRVCLWKT